MDGLWYKAALAPELGRGPLAGRTAGATTVHDGCSFMGNSIIIATFVFMYFLVG